MQNTHDHGVVTIFLYPKEERYIGVCLEFDIVDEDTDLRALKARMNERVQSYIAYICKNKKSEKLLNRIAPDEYWQEYFSYLKELQKQATSQKIRSKKPFFSLEIIPIQAFSPA